MTIDLCDKPTLEEFLEDARIITAIENDGGKHKRAFRMKLEMYNNDYAGGDWSKTLFMIAEGYKKQIQAVKTQEEYDALFQNVYDTSCIAFVISGDMRAKADKHDHHIKEITYTDFFCPCCGKELDDEFVDDLRKKADTCRQLEWFYGEFYEQRMEDTRTMRKIAKDKGFDMFNWQKNVKAVFGSRARVEDIEGEPSEVRQVLDALRTKAENEKKQSCVAKTKEWLAKRRAAKSKE